MHHRPGRERGVALLMALVVLTISATLAAAMVWDRHLDLRRTANIIQGGQAFELALGSEAWARQILHLDALKSKTDTLGEMWAQQLPPLPVAGGQIAGHLEDLQGRFNLNNLVGSKGKVDKDAVKQFEHLLAALGIDPDIAPAVVDWIDADSEPQFQGGAEDDVYSRAEPAYRTANRPMENVSELLEVHGITPQDYRKLAPFVAALPASGTTINVNTAPATVLRSLSADLSADEAANLVKERGKAGFASKKAFEQLAGSVEVHIPDNEIGVASQFFRLVSEVEIGSAHLTLYSLLERKKG
jgi:general secretion pathway protein K